MCLSYSMQRSEKKFFITEAQYDCLRPLMREHMQPDPYGCSWVSSLYCDTDDYAVIRSCLDFPQYKEKFRFRSYSTSEQRDLVYAELKKKYNGITAKCRVALPPACIPDFLSGKYASDESRQTVREIRWFMNRFGRLSPKVLIRCYREPWESGSGQPLRITLDRNLRWCTGHFDSADYDRGEPLLYPEKIVMEIKTPGAVPLWLCEFLSGQGIYCTGFSKYGTWYKTRVLPYR